MKCPRCGLSNPATARICTRCGTPLWNANRGGEGTIPELDLIDADSTVVRPINAHEATQKKSQGNAPRIITGGISPDPQNSDNRSEKKNPYSRSFVITLVVAVVIGIGLISTFAFVFSQASQGSAATNAEANKTSLIEVNFVIPDYVQGTSSQIPIRITGNDFTGAAVDQIEQMSLVDTSVSLKRGSYSFTPVGSPVTKGGTIFSLPNSVEVVVDNDGIKVNGVTSKGPSFEYTAIPADQTTDAQVQAIRSWMLNNSDMGATTISSFINAIASARLEALSQGLTTSQINKAQRANSFTTTSFSFAIPNTWKGEVQTIVDFNEYGLSRATIYAANTRYALAWIQTVPKDAAQTEVPEADHLVASFDSPSGADYRVEVWSRNWAGIAAAYAQAQANARSSSSSSFGSNSSSNLSSSSSSSSSSNNYGSYDASSLSELVQLSTGGTLTYRKATTMGTAGIGTPDIDFLRENLVPSVVAT